MHHSIILLIASALAVLTAPLRATECQTGMITAGASPQTATSFSSLKKALEASRDGWTITVGQTLITEDIEIKKKKNLRLIGLCQTLIPFLAVNHSTNIHIEGFHFGGKENAALVLGSNASGNSGITLKRNRITNSKGAGILIGKKNSGIQIVENEIYQNASYGIDMDPHGHLNPPTAVTLRGNYITQNNGTIIAGESSADLGHYGLYLDASDSRNITTTGTEGGGVVLDNCPSVFNPGQENADQDQWGDACDADWDNDLVLNEFDNCPSTSNPDQKDSFQSGKGDACNPDIDGDLLANVQDNCPLTPNPQQENLDGDSQGDACDEDRDNDLALNAADNCPDLTNADQANLDGDGLGDVCDDDLDGDSLANTADNCPHIANPSQLDLDQDGIGNACDPDMDGDQVADTDDNCPLVSNAGQEDLDHDGLGNLCDEDLDNDTIANTIDNCPRHANLSQLDFDENGVGDACQPNTPNILAKMFPVGSLTTGVVMQNAPTTINRQSPPTTFSFVLAEDPNHTAFVRLDASTSKSRLTGAPEYQWSVSRTDGSAAYTITGDRKGIMLTPGSYHIELTMTVGSITSSAQESITITAAQLTGLAGATFKLNNLSPLQQQYVDGKLHFSFDQAALLTSLQPGNNLLRLVGPVQTTHQLQIVQP